MTGLNHITWHICLSVIHYTVHVYTMISKCPWSGSIPVQVIMLKMYSLIG